MKKIGIVLFAVAIIIGGYIGFEAFQPPKVKFDEETISLKEGVALTEPSLGITMGHLKEMTKAPHPIGSKENKRVREYLVEQMEAMGYEVEQDPYTIPVNEKIAERATVEGEVLGDEVEGVNLMAIAEGKNSAATTFVVAHYDSTTFGPGAADDAIAVASILEAMRMAKMNAYDNTIVFLITDGEEVGLTGAEHFVNTHPEWKDKADFLINFEARGSRGGLVMFQTADNNHKMLQHLSKGSRSPIAVSMATEVYERAPNGTDLTQFLNAGYDGLMNFAVVEGAEHYHTPTDSYDELNRDTANHYLMMITDLTSYFGTLEDTNRTANEDAIYFPLYKGKILIMSETTAKVLAGISIVLAGVYFVLKGMEKGLSIKKMGISLVTFAIILLGSYMLGKTLVWATNTIFGIAKNAPSYLRWGGSSVMFMVAIILSILLTLFVLRTSDKKWELRSNFILLYVLFLIAGTLATLAIIPGASYLFIMPLLILTTLLLFKDIMARNGKEVSMQSLAIVFGFVQAVLYTPVIYLLFVVLTIPALPIVGVLTSFVALGCSSLFIVKE